MEKKDLIFYFVHKVISEFPKKWKHKLHRVYIEIRENEIRLHKGRRTFGFYKHRRNQIVYYTNWINLLEGDIYNNLKELESVVRHELLHAVGMTGKDMEEYRKNLKI